MKKSDPNRNAFILRDKGDYYKYDIREDVGTTKNIDNATPYYVYSHACEVADLLNRIGKRDFKVVTRW